MCCLFGILDYKNRFNTKQKNKIISLLSGVCEARGTDATGIAYNHNGHLSIYKRPLAAHKMRFDIPDVNLIMGHTRMTTQGNEKYNFNNHPFYCKIGNTEFALAHNGVLYNDITLRKTEKLPETIIETDSYIAVQLIEKQKRLDFASLGYMAERLSGSFTITVVDNDNNLYFVKGDNPMCIYHLQEAGIYIYASTEEILKTALCRIPYRFGKPKKIELEMGEILKIDRHGKMEKSEFDKSLLSAINYYSHFPYRHISISSERKTKSPCQQEYIRQLKSYASFYGYTDDMVDMLLDEGYTTDDIEEMLYCGVY